MAMSGGSKSEINVTPMIDVLLVLLIIFMVIQPTTPKGLGTQVPQKAAQPAAAAEPETTVVLSVAGDARSPRYRINTREVAQAEVVPELTRIFASRRERVMFVKGDPGMDFGSVAGAVGMGQQANATVGLLTREE